MLSWNHLSYSFSMIDWKYSEKIFWHFWVTATLNNLLVYQIRVRLMESRHSPFCGLWFIWTTFFHPKRVHCLRSIFSHFRFEIEQKICRLICFLDRNLLQICCCFHFCEFFSLNLFAWKNLQIPVRKFLASSFVVFDWFLALQLPQPGRPHAAKGNSILFPAATFSVCMSNGPSTPCLLCNRSSRRAATVEKMQILKLFAHFTRDLVLKWVPGIRESGAESSG